MIVVKIELWPRGDESHKIDLGRMTITNDLTSLDPTMGNYGVKIFKGQLYSRKPDDVWKTGRVGNFPRSSKQHGPWDLLYRALRTIVGDRNKIA